MSELWYAIAVLMLTAYVVLDGYDFGAGRASPLRGADGCRAAAGPRRDRPLLGRQRGVAARRGRRALRRRSRGSLASGISGFYFAIFLVLWCLILRGVAIEFRSHVNDPVWRGSWDVFFGLASVLLPVFFGAALGNLLRGVPLTAEGWFELPLFTDFSARDPVGILDWYTVLVGVFALAALVGHGGAFLVWRTDGAVRERSRRASRIAYVAVAVLWPVVTLATVRVNPGFLSSLAFAPARLASGVGRRGGPRVRLRRVRTRQGPRAVPGVLRLPGRPLDGDSGVRLSDDAASHRRRGAFADGRERCRRPWGPEDGPRLVLGGSPARGLLHRHRPPPASGEGRGGRGGRRLLTL